MKYKLNKSRRFRLQNCTFECKTGKILEVTQVDKIRHKVLVRFNDRDIDWMYEDILDDCTPYLDLRSLFPVSEHCNTTSGWRVQRPCLAIELPNTDCNAILYTDEQLEKFIEKHGNIEVVKGERLYSVPSFAVGRQVYSEAKSRWCNQYGCN